MHNSRADVVIPPFDYSVPPLFSLLPSWYSVASSSPWNTLYRSSSGFAGPRGKYGFASGFV